MKRACVPNGLAVAVEGHQALYASGGQSVDATGAGPVRPGWTYDGATFAATAATTLIRTEAFWERFTNGELVDYDVAMQHDPAATANAKKAAARLRIFQRDADAAGYRDLSANKVRSFVTGLEGGVLAVGRATIILDTPVTKREAWQP